MSGPEPLAAPKKARGLAEIEAILSSRPTRGANLRNFARRYGADRVVARGGSLLVRGTSDHAWTYLLPNSEEGGAGLLDLLEASDEYVVGFDDWLLTALKERRAVEWILYCRKLAWPAGRLPEAPRHSIRPLAAADAAYLQDHSDYGEYTSVPYIEDQIARGVGGGIEGPDGKLAAWALTHDDGAIGFLHVLEPYRRLGLAASLTSWMIGAVLARGEIPFVHIEPENAKSLSLALKTGFVDAGVAWWAKLGRG